MIQAARASKRVMFPTLLEVSMTSRLIASVLVSLGLFCAGGTQAAAPVKTADGMLVDHNGMTLYTFDNDAPGKSACNGGCATMWPPVMAATGAVAEGAMSIVRRDDGTMQWAHHGKPLYTYKQDTQPGDRKGDNFKSVWHTVKP
jgi:predicted lipoprotein with Yx(FWY)xxD motif